jgi:hypothetical protein
VTLPSPELAETRGISSFVGGGATLTKDKECSTWSMYRRGCCYLAVAVLLLKISQDHDSGRFIVMKLLGTRMNDDDCPLCPSNALSRCHGRLFIVSGMHQFLFCGYDGVIVFLRIRGIGASNQCIIQKRPLV